MTGVAIIGGGPSGLSAAIYTARADRRTLVFDSGGGTTRDVDTMENVYGFPDGVTGPELVELGREHARKFGAEIIEEEVVHVGRAGDTYRVETTVDSYEVDGGDIQTDTDQSTAAERVYAAGDVTGGHQQISTSVGEGARAAINLLEEFRGADYVDYKKLDDAAAD